MSEWKEVRFEEAFEIPLRNGLTKPSKIRGAGLKMVNMKEIFAYDKISDSTDMELVPFEDKERNSLLQYNDLLFARQSLVESGAGKVAIYKGRNETVFESHLIRCRINAQIFSPDFVYYYWKSPIGKGHISTIVTQTAAAGIKGSVLQTLPIPLPPILEQTTIASILSCLDDKIDLLRRQNATLEKMAETLFRQWFVEESLVQSENQILLGDLIESVSITHKFPNKDVVFLNTSDIYLGNVLVHEPLDVKTLPGQAKKTIKKDDILFSEIRPANGRWAYIDFDADNYVVSTKLMVLRSKGKISQAFVYFYLTNSEVVTWLQMIAESRSGTFPQITFDQLKDLVINVPSKEIFDFATSWCEMTLNKIKSNQTQIRTLTALRDTLLPKLMCGEVRVEM